MGLNFSRVKIGFGVLGWVIFGTMKGGLGFGNDVLFLYEIVIAVVLLLFVVVMFCVTLELWVKFDYLALLRCLV